LQRTNDVAGLLVQTAAFLRDLPAAWEAASQEQRNALARLVFQAVKITDDQVTAVLPQPDFAPFFVALRREDDDTPDDPSGVSSSKVATWRKRRALEPQRPNSRPCASCCL